MNLTASEVRALYDENQGGVALAAIAKRLGTSHETLRQHFLRYGYDLRTPAQVAAQKREQLLQQQRELRPVIEELYRKWGTLDAVCDALDGVAGLPRKMISDVIHAMPDRELHRRRGVQATYGEETLKAHLRIAAEEMGEPLSGMKYQQVAPQLGLAAYNTQVKAFGSFPEALKAAGVKGNLPRGRRASAFTREQCVTAVMQCLRAHGGRVSYDTYCRWVPQGQPSGATVRNLVGWNRAVEHALDRLG